MQSGKSMRPGGELANHWSFWSRGHGSPRGAEKQLRKEQEARASNEPGLCSLAPFGGTGHSLLLALGCVVCLPHIAGRESRVLAAQARRTEPRPWQLGHSLSQLQIAETENRLAVADVFPNRSLFET